MYYFDYASTTKPSEKNIELYSKLLADVFEHPADGNKADKLLSEAERIILNSLQLNNSHKVIFTSGGTEANNLAIIGYAQAFSSKKHFITTKYEHSSVDSSFKHLEDMGHQVTYLNVTTDGTVDYSELKSSLSENTVLVSIMAVNNEIGTVNDVRKIKDIIDNFNPNIIYMSDCVQAVGKINYDYNKLDLLTISGHKLYAPKGIGAVIYKDSINLSNVIYGGAQQGGIRPGTLSVASAVVLAVALQTEIKSLSETQKIVDERRNQFTDFITNHPKVELNVNPMSGIVSVCFKTKALSESIIAVLNSKQIYASTKSACSRKLNVHSRTLTSIKLSGDQIERTIRFSFSHNTTKEEVDYLISALTEILEIY